MASYKRWGVIAEIGRAVDGVAKIMSDSDSASFRQHAQVTPPEMPGLKSLLTLVTGVVVVSALYLAREVLIPFTLAILLSFVLAPLVEALRRLYVPHVLSVLVAALIGLGAIGAVGGVIGMQVAGLAADVPQYASTIETKITSVRAYTLGRITELTNRLDRQMTAPVPQPLPSPEVSKQAPDQKPIPVEVKQPASDPLSLARSVLEPILAPFESALIIFIVAVFILLQKEDLRDRLIRLFGSGDLHRATVAMDDAAHRLSRYFLAQLGINTMFGVAVGIGLALIGLPSPLLWGVLSAILRFVPYIGPMIAAVLPATLAAAVSPHWSMLVWTLGLFAVTESITGQVIEPMVYGHSTGLSPVAVVIAAIFWSWLWGPIGLIISTPLTLCLVVLGRHVDRLEFLDVLLGDRPALTPIENFYQRMLANDPDEALQQAELLLMERSLTAYYDEVAVKGLQLAANDAERGVLGAEKLERIKHSVRSLVNDLGSHDDRDPHPAEKEESQGASSKAERDISAPAASNAAAPAADNLAPGWRTASPVLCLAGRGPLDEAASSILVQLLGKHGLGARAAPYENASRDSITKLDVEGVAMVCISYLEITGGPAALHYLVRRLRQRIPGIPILVGLWPSEDAVLKDDRVRAVIGADYFTTSLREALDTCIVVAHQKAEAACSLARDGISNAR
jgi:predicted PurR-regulated permease PerM